MQNVSNDVDSHMDVPSPVKFATFHTGPVTITDW